LIERAVRGNDPRFDFPDRGMAIKSEARAIPEPTSGRSARTLKFDLNRLRRQNIIVPGGDRTPIAECFRRIKRPILANVASAEFGTAANLVMVTSPQENTGKTFCAINLAISIAMELDRTVLLVDVDLAKPSIPSVFGVNVERGLMDLLLDRNVELADVLCRTNIEKLSLLAAGKKQPNATELLASETMRELLRELAERYQDRIVVFDSPPLLKASEAAVLASRMGQIVMVVEALKTTGSELKDALSRIESCNRVSLLLNKGEVPGSYYFGGYGS